MVQQTPRFDLTTSSGTKDFTALVSTATLSGDYRQACRTLTLEILVSPDDKGLPQVFFQVGGTVRLTIGGTLLFYGHVFSKTKSTDSSTMTVTCFDRGIYLKNNEGTYNFRNQTPEAITQRVCKDFGIGVYALTKTGVKISRKFSGAALYSIIDTAYTLASEKTGKRYMTRFIGANLGVFEKSTTKAQRTIQPGSNLMTAAYSESIENMVNRVSIHDSDDKFLTNVSDTDAVQLYGLMRRVIRQSKDRDATAEAKKLLGDNGVERKAILTVLGDLGLVTGETVLVKEPYTGLDGVFWIDTDSHTWQNGVWQTKLTLNFRNLMREGTAGSEEN